MQKILDTRLHILYKCRHCSSSRDGVTWSIHRVATLGFGSMADLDAIPPVEADRDARPPFRSGEFISFGVLHKEVDVLSNSSPLFKCCLVACGALFLFFNAPPSWAQMGSVGTVNVLVVDPKGC